MVGPAAATVIAGGTKAGGNIIGNLISLYGTLKAGRMQAEAQREANAMNLLLFREGQAGETRQFDIENALTNMKFRLAKEDSEWTKDFSEDKKGYDRAMDFANRLGSLVDRGQQNALTSISAFQRPQTTITPQI